MALRRNHSTNRPRPKAVIFGPRERPASLMVGTSLVAPCCASGPARLNLPDPGNGSGQPNPHEESGK